MNKDEVEKSSGSEVIIQIVVSTVFMAIGIWVVIEDSTALSIPKRFAWIFNQFGQQTTGMIIASIFGLSLIQGIYKLVRRKR